MKISHFLQNFLIHKIGNSGFMQWSIFGTFDITQLKWSYRLYFKRYRHETYTISKLKSCSIHWYITIIIVCSSWVWCQSGVKGVECKLLHCEYKASRGVDYQSAIAMYCIFWFNMLPTCNWDGFGITKSAKKSWFQWFKSHICPTWQVQLLMGRNQSYWDPWL